MSSFRDGVVMLGTIASDVLSAITAASVLSVTIGAILGAITVAILLRLLASRGHTAVSMATSCQSGGVTDTGCVILV